MDIGKYGVFYFLDSLTAGQAADFAKEVERLGYGALWFPEAVGRNSMVTAAWLLSHTGRLVVASGIANIYARDPQAAVAARKALDELSGGRYLLGLGVSHAPFVEDVRGHSFHKPLARMKEYLEKMGRAVYQAPAPAVSGETVLGALGPQMTALSARLADGAHPYNVTPEHTAWARKIVGPEKRVYVEHKVVLETDPHKARAAAKQSLDFYLGLPNYRNNWLRLGFSQEDLAGPSDRFLDEMVYWGDADTIARKLNRHLEAGADHVCIQPLGDNPLECLRALAEKLSF